MIFGALINPGRRRLGPLRHHDRGGRRLAPIPRQATIRGHFPQMLPDLLGEKRHDRMEEAENRVEREEKHCPRLIARGRITQSRLAKLEIGAAKLVPRKGVEGPRGIGEAVFVGAAVHFGRHARQPAGEPAILEGLEGAPSPSEIVGLVILEIHQHESGGVPELVGEVAPRLEALRERRAAGEGEIGLGLGPLRLEGLFTFRAFDPRLDPVLHRLLDPRLARRALKLHRHPHVLRLGGERRHPEAEGIGPESLDDVERIDAVPLALAHRLAVAIKDLGVDVDLAEGKGASVKHPHDHHSRYPQRDDVAAGEQRRAGIEGG